MRALTEPKISSYLAYLVPLATALSFGEYAVALIIAFAVIVGFLYHWYGETRYERIDSLAAWILIVSNTVLCIRSDFKEPFFVLAVLALIASLYFYARAQKGSYSLYHGLWHVGGALITQLCVMMLAR